MQYTYVCSIQLIDMKRVTSLNFFAITLRRLCYLSYLLVKAAIWHYDDSVLHSCFQYETIVCSLLFNLIFHLVVRVPNLTLDLFSI